MRNNLINFILLFLTAIICFLLILCSNPPQFMTTLGSTVKETKVVKSKPADVVVSDQRGKCAPASKPPLSALHIRNVAVEDAAHSEALSLSYSQPKIVEAKAQTGDSTAAIALFEMLASCYPNSNGLNRAPNSTLRVAGCPEVSDRLANNSLLALEPAISKGDLAAMTVYAINAPAIAKTLQTIGSEEAIGAAKNIVERAERLGVLAAEGGGKEAMYFLSRAYANGFFGVRNLASAYTYLLPLAKLDPSANMTQHLAMFRKNMTIEDRRMADIRAMGCELVSDPAELVSPFKIQ